MCQQNVDAKNLYNNFCVNILLTQKTYITPMRCVCKQWKYVPVIRIFPLIYFTIVKQCKVTTKKFNFWTIGFLQPPKHPHSSSPKKQWQRILNSYLSFSKEQVVSCYCIRNKAHIEEWTLAYTIKRCVQLKTYTRTHVSSM